ncbi:MAG: hypothetical protein ISS71_10070 [Phycisphaerae bacterium]|nr:hypothetical protein [Phycisphaerae bacterium]
MSLNYFKEYSLGSVSEKVTPQGHNNLHPKMSKPKFFVLLTSNVLLWLFVSGFYLEINPASMRESIHEFSKRRGLVVTGVVCNSKMQAAIISDEIYSIGDSVKGYTITNINREGVELKKGKKKVFKKITSL